MAREVVATPLFARNLQEFLDEYSDLGAVRFVERLRQSYVEMVENITTFQDLSCSKKSSSWEESYRARICTRCRCTRFFSFVLGSC